MNLLELALPLLAAAVAAREAFSWGLDPDASGASAPVRRARRPDARRSPEGREGRESPPALCGIC